MEETITPQQALTPLCLHWSGDRPAGPAGVRDEGGVSLSTLPTNFGSHPGFS